MSAFHDLNQFLRLQNTALDACPMVLMLEAQRTFLARVLIEVAFESLNLANKLANAVDQRLFIHWYYPTRNALISRTPCLEPPIARTSRDRHVGT